MSTSPDDRYSIGVRGTWWPLSLEWFLEDGHGRTLNADQVNSHILNTLTPEQRSQWFFISTVWPHIKHRVYMFAAFVLCLVCMLTLFAAQSIGR